MVLGGRAKNFVPSFIIVAFITNLLCVPFADAHCGRDLHRIVEHLQRAVDDDGPDPFPKPEPDPNQKPVENKLTLSKLAEVLPSFKKYWTPIIPAEAAVGAINIVASEAVATGMVIHDFSTAVAVPLIVLDHSLNAALVIPREFWTKHNIRLMELHPSLPYIRQALIGIFCSTAFKIVANYQHLGDLTLTHAGAEVLVATFLNTLWRTPTNSSVDNWVKQADNPITDLADRRTAASSLLLPFSLIGGPMYIFSLMPDQNVLASLPLLEVNQWHLGMMGMALVGGIFWKFPKLFNPAAKTAVSTYKFFKNLVRSKSSKSSSGENPKIE